MYWSIMLIGFIVSWIPVNYWCKLFDRIVSKNAYLNILLLLMDVIYIWASY